MSLSATPSLSRWRLTDLLPSTDEQLVTDRLSKLEEAVAELEGARAELETIESDRLLELVRQTEHIHTLGDVLSGFAGLWFSEDTQSSDALAFQNRIQDVLTKLNNRLLFFSLWWKSLDDDDAARLLPPAEREPDIHHYLTELRRFKPFTLDESAEKIINIKDANGIDALMTLHSMLTSRLEFKPADTGSDEPLTEGETRARFYSPDPEVRAEAYRSIHSVYKREAPILAQIYANRVRDWAGEHVDLRGMDSPISVRNLANDIPGQAVSTLLDVVEANVPLFHRFFRLKASWLGMTKLRRFDLYAPLDRSQRTIPWSEAVESVLDTFRGFDSTMAELAERVFDQHHIDSEVRPGKRGGAFCATISPRLTPWVLINYTGKVRDVATLAHELGHAIHSMLASDHSCLTHHPSLPLAETASVFSEMLMTDRLLAREDDPLARRNLLAGALDDIYATVIRQAFFVRFEIAAHAAVLDGASAENLFSMYRQNLDRQFADSLELDPDFRYEWVSIPHLYATPFYCYAYSFGQLLVLALYRRYRQQGEAFKPGYLRLLSHGGGVRPHQALAELDIDVSDASFWQGGFDVVEQMLDELESTS